MAGPLVASKLYLPKLHSGVVSRPRLLERLHRGSDARLTLVAGPAGFGKTTLLAEWLSQGTSEDRSVAWLSLDSSDGQPASFWTYVLTALQAAIPGVGSTALALMTSSPDATELPLTLLLNELDAVPTSVWLVLDDYHLVDNREVAVGMTFLVQHLPPKVHVVLSTRADPDLPLSRWRARGELVEVRAADLRFTSQEAAALLNDVAGLGLAAQDQATLQERTEGWVAALQLAALSLQGRDDVGGFVAQFAGTDRYIVDYLVEDVLAHQPDPVRRFLLRTSVLDRFTGPLCDAVTGGRDGTAMLLVLERANLFLVPLDDRREWYRYHHLFADVLRARLPSEEPEQVRLLHQRASAWFADQDMAEDAVRHALAAADVDRAAHLMEMAVPTIRRNRQDHILVGWLQALPDDVIRRSPVLSVFYGHLLLHSGDLAAVASRLDDAESALATAPAEPAAAGADTQELHSLPATIAITRASLAQARGDVAGTAAHARRALDLADPDDHLARAGAAGFLGLAAWASGDVPGALDTFAPAVANLHQAGNLVDELAGTVVLADLWLTAGRPGNARRVYERALQTAQAHDEPAAWATAALHVGLSELDREVGDLDSARRHLDVAAVLGEQASVSESRYRWFVAAGLLARAQESMEDAIDLLDQGAALYRPGFSPDVRPIPAMKARIRVGQGQLSEATDWARQRGVEVTDGASYLNEFDHLTLVRLRIAQHRVRPDNAAMDEISRLLDRLLEAAETSERAGSALEIRMLQALTHQAQGHQSRAREVLDQALVGAPEPDAYVRLFLDEGPAMVALLRDAAHHESPHHAPTRHDDTVDDAAARDHVHRLLALGAADEPRPAAEPTGGPSLSPDSLSERELQVLKLLAGELSGPQIARELFVSHNTVRTHTKHIFTKLGVTNRRAALGRGRERGLL